MTQRVDVVVVGAGAMGAATAWWLAKQGRSVALLEQFTRGHLFGSSHGQTRIFRVSYRDPIYTALAQDAIPLWRELESDSGCALLEQSGQLDHGYGKAIDEVELSLRDAGYGYERLDPIAAHDRWPALNFDSSVIYSPDGGRVFADRTVEAATAVAESHGAQTHFESPVRAIEPHGEGVAVVTDNDTWIADTVVVSAGSWLTQLLGPDSAWARSVPLPGIEVTEQQPVHFAIKPGMHFPSYIHHVPDDIPGASLRFGAYGLESPGEGVKLGLETNVAVANMQERDLSIDPAALQEAIDYAQQWLPGADTSQAAAVSCLFTMTPDAHFILDRRGPVVVCSPCSGHGFKFTPAIGKIAAELAMGGQQEQPQWRLPA
jgi:sarcosine oxidase